MLRAGAGALGAALVLSACAAGGIPRAPTMDEPGAEAEGPAEYERILGSFVVSPEALVHLTPELAAARLDPGPDRGRGYARVVSVLREAGVPQAEAVGSMNLGAIAWFDDRPEDAYRSMMRAQHLFAEIGDLEGLAHVYEWLGFFFAESGASARAEEHLGLAYELFGLLGDEASKARVLRLAE